MYNIKEINAKALVSNLKYVKTACDKNVMVMVKADAYGHGVKNVVRILKNKVKLWGVANSIEALQLRKLINKDSVILIVGFSNNYRELIKNNISMTVDNIKQIKEINRAAKSLNKIAKIHIKINTGMNRNGLKSVNLFKQLLSFINKTPNLKLEGVYTHFFDADEVNNNVNKQVKTFKKYIQILSTKNILIHVGGSFAINHALPQFVNMIRCGFFVYGYGCKSLQPVMQIKSKILKITKIKNEQYIGYGKTKIKNKRVALIPFGYADGLSRNLYKNGYVLINNTKCKILGKICMDVHMCDVTNCVARVGDDVVVFNNAYEWARLTSTSPYEILTNFCGSRTKDIINFNC